MRRKLNRVWLKERLVPVLLPLWAIFAASWVIISTRYSLHLDLFPMPMAGGISMNLVALVLYMPPVVLLLTILDVAPIGGVLGLALVLLGWVLAALLLVAVAFAVPTLI